MKAFTQALSIAVNDLAGYILGGTKWRTSVTDDKARSALELLAAAASNCLGAGIHAEEVNAKWAARPVPAFGPWQPVSALADVPRDEWIVVECVGVLGRTVAHIRADMVGSKDWPCVSRFARETRPVDPSQVLAECVDAYARGSSAPAEVQADDGEPKILGPIEIELKVHMAHPDGQQGVATYAMPVGQPVSADGLEIAVRSCLDAVGKHGFRLMGPDTFFNRVLIKDRTGRAGNFAVPLSMEYTGFGLEMQELDRVRGHEDEDEGDDDEG